jgi:hypothetical protein
MYMPTAEAARLLTRAMKAKTAAERLRASDEALPQLNRIAAHPDVPFEAFRERYLRDCLEARDDNWKDAVQDAKNLVKDAKKFGKTHEASANKHLADVVKRVTKEMEKDPGLKRYLRGLL